MVIVKYEKFKEMILEHQEDLKDELVELSESGDLSRDEREFMNTLMDYIGYTNTMITISENRIKRLKDKM